MGDHNQTEANYFEGNAERMRSRGSAAEGSLLERRAAASSGESWIADYRGRFRAWWTTISLRRKLEEKPADPKYLLSVRGLGYRFENAAENLTET